MKVLKTKELWTWLLVNILAPTIVPLCFVLLVKMVIHIDKNVLDIVEMLWAGGAYIFLSLFVLISLVPHLFDGLPKKEKILTCYIAVTIIVLFVTCFLYLSYLKVISSENAVSFEENSSLSGYVTILGIIIACGFKVSFLQAKEEKCNSIAVSCDTMKID